MKLYETYLPFAVSKVHNSYFVVFGFILSVKMKLFGVIFSLRMLNSVIPTRYRVWIFFFWSVIGCVFCLTLKKNLLRSKVWFGHLFGFCCIIQIEYCICWWKNCLQFRDSYIIPLKMITKMHVSKKILIKTLGMILWMSTKILKFQNKKFTKVDMSLVFYRPSIFK